ncbi:FtsX-like permease family protein [Agreia bicolorata]|uniref:FtsX-like permease family protein n=1 Tax=Agreia bicolorata TaxID=110935 RepID=UPI001379315A|nr:FtsX-like permease family protein [Agreia bicolorata]
MLLLLGSAVGSLHDRTTRSAWLSVGGERAVSAGLQTPLENNEIEANSVAAYSDIDFVRQRPISELVVATSAPHGMELPGGLRPPQPGEYRASPALQRLIDTLPPEELGNRYGRSIGTLPTDILESDDMLAVVVGASGEQVYAAGGYAIAGWNSSSSAADAYDLIAIAGSIMLLLPILLLIGAVTDLGGSQRAERLATLRLIGATPGRVSRLAALETALAAAAGTLLGSALFSLVGLALRTVAPKDQLVVPGIIGVDFYRVLLVGIAVIAVSSGIAGVRALFGRIGPLGSQRPIVEDRPSVLRLIPLALGLTGLVCAVMERDASPVRVFDQRSLYVTVLFVSVILLLGGLLWAGPTLLSVAARVAGLLARGATSTLAAARVACSPRATFRGVSGAAAVMFIASLLAGGIGATSAPRQHDGGLPASTVFAFLDSTAPKATGPNADAVAAWRDVPGITSAALGTAASDVVRFVVRGQDAPTFGLAPAGESLALDLSSLFSGQMHARAVQTFPDGAAPYIVAVATDGKSASIDRARTLVLSSGLPLRGILRTSSDDPNGPSLLQNQQFTSLAVPALLFIAFVAALIFGVSTIAQLLDRRRILSLLRLTGMPLTTIQRTLALETAAPAIGFMVLASILGYISAGAILATVTTGRQLNPPSAIFVAILVTFVALLLFSLAATFKTARKSTEPITLRFE